MKPAYLWVLACLGKRVDNRETLITNEFVSLRADRKFVIEYHLPVRIAAN